MIGRNAMEPDGNVPTTLVDLLQWRAREASHETAFIFLSTEGAESPLTYAGLDRRARTIASALRSVSEPGDRVLVLLPTGPDYVAAFFGCLYAGVVAVPAFTPRTNEGLARLEAIAADAKPAAALGSRAVQTSLCARLSQHTPELAGCAFVIPDDLTEVMDYPLSDCSITAETLAYLQYTSGSTGSPKGVMLTHANVLHNCEVIRDSFGMNQHSRGVMWLPLYHDMGLVGGLLEPLYAGIPCVLMSPIAFMQRPVRWLEAITRYRATVSGGPDFAYALCSQKVTPAERTTLDLSSWQVAFSGGESIRASTVELFHKTFAASGFRPEAFNPCYGLAEATLLASGGRVGVEPSVVSVSGPALERTEVKMCAPGDVGARTLVSSGRVLGDQVLAIVDPVSHVLYEQNRVGEIWLSGPSVARGYWNHAAETTSTFHCQSPDAGDRPFLGTGDLGFILDGELFVAGRLKDLIIIRGRNHYPEDIEQIVEQSHVGLRPGSGAAFSVDVAAQERLVVVHELGREHRSADAEEVASDIRQAIGKQLGLQVYAVVLLKPGTIPKTSSGKIRRRNCRERFLSDTLEVLGVSILDDRELADRAIGDERRVAGLEVTVMKAFATVLRLERVDILDDFFAVGGDSLAGVQLVAGLSERLNIAISPTDLANAPSVRELALLIAERKTTERLHVPRQTEVGIAEREERLGTVRKALIPSWSPLVPLHPDGGKRPFYCVHPGTGSVSGYTHLARRLGPERPFFGLQAPGLWDDQDPFSEVPTMAQLYLRSIRASDPGREYLLGGYCTGGTIAFEMAQQLQGEGRRVACLILIDTWAPNSDKPGDDGSDELARLISEFAPVSAEDIRGLPLDEQVGHVLKASARAGMLPVAASQLTRFVRTALAIERARQNYSARLYSGDVSIIRSSDRPFDREDDGAMGWRRLVRGRIDIYPMNCGHLELMQPERGETLAHLIGSILDRV